MVLTLEFLLHRNHVAVESRVSHFARFSFVLALDLIFLISVSLTPPQICTLTLHIVISDLSHER